LLLFAIGPLYVPISQSIYEDGIKLGHIPLERGADIKE
jgi:hypothetical protein